MTIYLAAVMHPSLEVYYALILELKSGPPTVTYHYVSTYCESFFFVSIWSFDYSLSYNIIFYVTVTDRNAS